MPGPAITISDLTVARGGRTILDRLSLDIAGGRITGLLGPSGCGKTTLLRSIVGVQVVAGGTVTVLGAEAGSPQLRSRVGYVTQAPSVYGDLTVSENLRYFARVLGAGPAREAEAVTAVGLEGHEREQVMNLSGGERARVSLATALLNEPPLLILDEPTVGLDPVLRNELWARFRALADAGTTLVVSSHVMDEAERCDDLILMRDGAVLACEPRPSLLERTGADTVEHAFLHLIGAE